jgi:DNA-binding IclR family transcriptional regulator
MAGKLPSGTASLRDSSETPGAAVKVLLKAGTVLDFFLESRKALRVDEISRQLSLSKTTTYRLVLSMERIGLLERDVDNRAFRLGVKVLQLGVLAEEQLDIRRLAQPILADLTAITHQTSFLTVLRYGMGICVERVAGSYVDILALKVGGALPLHCGAGPRVLLAGLPDSSIEEYTKEVDWKPLALNTITTAEDLWRDVARTRAERYVLSDEDVTPGVCALGAPVFDAIGEVAAAISIAGLKTQYDREELNRLVTATRDAAKRLSNRLGAPCERYRDRDRDVVRPVVPAWRGASSFGA